MPNWPRIDVEVDAAASEDIGAELLEAGATGIEQVDLDGGSVRLVAYFPAGSSLSEIAAILASREGVRSPPLEGQLPDDDWLRLWKRGFEPVPLGSRLLVLPSWKSELAVEWPDRTHIVIDPGMAFGTGTHETTRLCLEWIDENWRGGSFLDVGTGTGILAIAAALLEPGSRVVAVDIDPVAIEVARENAEANGNAQIELSVGGPGDIPAEFDVVMANITADAIASVAEELLARLSERGSLVLSGVLVEQRGEVEELFATRGVVRTWLKEDGEWCALAVQRG